MADIEKNVIQVLGEPGTITLLTGDAPAPINPQNVKYAGNLMAPASWFQVNKEGILPSATVRYPDCVVLADENKGRIELIVNHQQPPTTTVQGELTDHPDLNPFCINEDKGFSVDELKKLFRRHKHLFASEERHAAVLVKLEKFNATVQRRIKNENDRKGNISVALEQETDIGGDIDFALTARLFKGDKPVTFTVDVLPEPTDVSVKFYLDSPDLITLKELRKQELFAQALEPFMDEEIAIVFA